MWHYLSSLFIFIFAWYHVKKRFHKNKKQITHTSIPNKTMLFLLMLSFALQMFCVALIISLLMVCVFLIIKLLNLEQVARVADGQYPYSTEKVLQTLLSYLLDKRLLLFFLSAFFLMTCVLGMLVFVVLPEETRPDIIHNQIVLLMDVMLLILVSSFVVWHATSSGDDLNYVFLVTPVLVTASLIIPFAKTNTNRNTLPTT